MGNGCELLSEKDMAPVLTTSQKLCIFALGVCKDESGALALTTELFVTPRLRKRGVTSLQLCTH